MAAFIICNTLVANMLQAFNIDRVADFLHSRISSEEFPVKATYRTNPMVPVLPATPKLWNKIILSMLPGVNLADLKMVVVMAPETETGGFQNGKPSICKKMKNKAQQFGRYFLRKGLGVWKLIFNGMEAVIKDCRGIALVAHLLFNHKTSSFHGSELAALVLGQAMVQEGSLGGDGETTQKKLKEVAGDCMAVIQDPSASELEKAEATKQLEDLAECRQVAGHSSVSGAEKQVRAVRRAIERFIGALRMARDRSKRVQQALRAFGEHLHQYMWIPSSRYGGSRRARVQTGTAGRFVYERPSGVRWQE